jgi:hypothetical protein
MQLYINYLMMAEYRPKHVAVKKIRMESYPLKLHYPKYKINLVSQPIFFFKVI